MIRFKIQQRQVIKNLTAHRDDFLRTSGTIGTEIRFGMHTVYDRVVKRLKNVYTGQHRRYLDYNAEYRDKAAPRVVKSEIKSQLRTERKARYSIHTSRGFFTFGLGNIEDMDRATDEMRISRIKAGKGETPEQNRVFPGRSLHSIWEIIEYGAAEHTIAPISGQGLLMFFDHRPDQRKGARRKSTHHPGQSGKHIFLRAEHEIYHSDLGAISNAISRGLKAQIKRYHPRVGA